MKSEILKALRETDGYLSGQELCDRFEVSRTAIWKVIHQLKEEGYSIEAVRNKGYHMIDEESPDVMNQQTIMSHIDTEKLGKEVVYLTETDSTNIQAKVLAEQGYNHGTLVVADMQKSGRGRRGRAWESPAGSGIFMTLLLKPKFSPQKAPMLTLLMAYALAKCIREVEGLEACIKWPNDIVVGNKKVCGILTEMSTEIDYINYVVVGVGINANTEHFPEELRAVATSLKLQKDGVQILRARLIGRVIKEFEDLYEKFEQVQDLSIIMEQYNEMLINKDKCVRVLEPGNEYEAFALGIDEHGELLVRREDERVEKVYAGEVSVRGIYGYV